jgi:hypothetical protein
MLKKKVILSAVILLICYECSYSQFEYYKPDTTRTKHLKGERSFSLSPNLLTNTQGGAQFAGGLKTRFFISKKISLDADLMLGRDYLHFGPGLLALPLLLFEPGAFNGEYYFESFGDYLVFLGFYLLSFEHIAYHVPLKQYTDLSPYVSILRFKSAGENRFSKDNNGGYDQVCFAAGVEINKYIRRFYISPYIEYNIGYKDHISGVYLGVNCGITFPSRF